MINYYFGINSVFMSTEVLPCRTCEGLVAKFKGIGVIFKVPCSQRYQWVKPDQNSGLFL